MKKDMFKREAEVESVEEPTVVGETQTTDKEGLYMNGVTVTPTIIPEGETPFYYGYYSVDNFDKRGQLMDILKDTGETRKCPCMSIAVSLKHVEAMVELGYRFKNKDESVFKDDITKRNIKKYINKVRNLINYGFLVEK